MDKLITSWTDFEEWRHASIEYHRRNEYRYTNALNYFEYARRYFDSHDFPEAATRNPPTKTNPLGTERNWTQKESKEQLKEISDWIHEQKATKKSKRKKATKKK